MSTPSVTKRIDQELQSKAGELEGRLGRLVGFATVNPPGSHYAAITDHLKEELEACGLRARKLTPKAALQKEVLNAEPGAEPRHNVLGKLKVKGAGNTLHFNAHYDVVPAGPGWRQGNPFQVKMEKGWIYGRGTADMKGSIASLLLALGTLNACKVRPAVNLEVSFTADEETDSLLGAGWLVEHGALNADAALVMEGAEGNTVCCGHNGVVWLEVEVIGKAAHGSRPDKGVNALEKMAALVCALEHYKVILAEDSFRAPDGTVMHPTINIGGVFSQGLGGKINTVPDLARFTIDRRVLPNESTQGVENELRDILEAAARSIPGCRIRIRKISENHACFSEPTAPIFKVLGDCIESVRGGKVQHVVSSGFTDMQFFAQHLGIPTLGYGPGGEGEHAVDERARLSDLLASARIYARLMVEGF